jgi:hypothetical protein
VLERQRHQEQAEAIGSTKIGVKVVMLIGEAKGSGANSVPTLTRTPLVSAEIYSASQFWVIGDVNLEPREKLDP